MAEEFDLQQVVDTLVPVMNGTRQRRIAIEAEWLLNYRAWQGWPSQTYTFPLPSNAIHYFIPHARRVIERNVQRASDLALPNRQWCQNLPMDMASHERASAVFDALEYVNQKKLNMKLIVDSSLRCLQLYNFACVLTSAKIQNAEVWPHKKAVDPFNFYLFPETSIDESEALLLFEDSIIPYQVYNSFVDRKDEKKSLYKFLSPDALDVPVWPYHLIERLAYRGLTQPSDFHQGNSPSTRVLSDGEMIEKLDKNRTQAKADLAAGIRSFVSLSKVYFRVSSKWFFAVICNNLRAGHGLKSNYDIVRFDQAENTPLYRWCSGRNLPGELYTNSKTDDIRTLQNIANNAISDVEANRQQVQTNPLAIDGSQVGRMQEMTLGNRKVFMFQGSPRDVMTPLPLADVTDQGTRMWQLYLSLLDKGSGGGLAEGEPGRNMPRAGFASQNLMDMANVEVRDDVKLLSQYILTPGLADTYHILLEYTPNKQLIKIPNVKPELIKAYKTSDLSGDYSFSWLAEVDVESNQAKADKFAQFASILLNPQLFPALMQELQLTGKTLDLEYLINTLYMYSLGEQGLTSLIRDLTPEEKQRFEEQQQQPDPKLMVQQQRGQHQQQKFQMDAVKMQQQMGLEREKHQALMQGKLIDLKGKQMELAGNTQLKQLDIQGKQVQNVGNMLRSIGDHRNGSRDEK